MARGSWLVVRGSWFVARGSWFVVRGSWFVARGSWLVVRGSWLVARRGRPKGRPACGNPVCWRPIIRGCVIHRIRGGLPTREPLRLRSMGPRRTATCGLRPAACVFTGFAVGSLRGSPYDCGPWDRGDLRTADCGLRYPQDSGGTPFGRPLRCGPWDRCGLRTALSTGFAAGSPRGSH